MAETNTLYSAVPDNGSLVQLLRTALGPLILQALGHQAGAVSPYTAPAQSVAGARYSAQVTGPEWDRVQNDAIARLMAGAGGGLRQALGGLNSDAGDKIGEKIAKAMEAGAATGIGRQIGAFALQSGPAQTVMGGNPLAAFQSAFVARNAMFRSQTEDAFGRFGLQDPFADAKTIKGITDNSLAVSTAVMQSIRGRPDGTLGIAQNMAYTRGFKDQELMAGLAASAEAGLRIESPEHAKGIVAAQAKAMEAMGDILGSREYGQLMAAAGKLTMGRYATMDTQAIEGLRTGIRNLEALARVANVDGGRVLDIAATMSASAARSIGLTADDIRAGRTGGGYTDIVNMVKPAAAAILASRINQTSAEFESERIMALDATTKGSRSGRELAAVAYAASTGRYAKGEFDELTAAITGGASLERRQAMLDKALTAGFGSLGAARAMMNDDVAFARARADTRSDYAARVDDTARVGAQLDFATAVTTAADAGRVALARPLMSALGRSFEKAGYFASSVRKLAGGNAAAAEALEEYDANIEGGMRVSTAESRLRRRLAVTAETGAISAEASRMAPSDRAEAVLGDPGAADIVGATAGIAALRRGGRGAATKRARDLLRSGDSAGALAATIDAVNEVYGEGSGTAAAIRRDMAERQKEFGGQADETSAAKKIAEVAAGNKTSVKYIDAMLANYETALTAVSLGADPNAKGAVLRIGDELRDAGLSEFTDDFVAPGDLPAYKARLAAVRARVKETTLAAAQKNNVAGLDSAGVFPGAAAAAEADYALFAIDDKGGLIVRTAETAAEDSDKLQETRAGMWQALGILMTASDDPTMKRALSALTGRDIAGEATDADKRIAAETDGRKREAFLVKSRAFDAAKEHREMLQIREGLGADDPELQKAKAAEAAARSAWWGAAEELQADVEGTPAFKRHRAAQEMSDPEKQSEHARLRQKYGPKFTAPGWSPRWLARLTGGGDGADIDYKEAGEKELGELKAWERKEQDEQKKKETSAPAGKKAITGTLTIVMPDGSKARGQLIGEES